jgi:acyl dehydratase
MSGAPESEKSASSKLLQPGSDLGSSSWFTVTEAMNQRFADVTLDPEPMRIDGVPHAHGFLTVSLLSALMTNALQLEKSGSAMPEGYLLNYGFDRLRLVEPIPLGARIRGHFKTSERGTTQRGPITIIPVDVNIEIENTERPALVGEWLAAWRK